MDDDAPKCSSCEELMAPEPPRSEDRWRAWRCRCGRAFHEPPRSSAPKPDRARGRCWLSWDDPTQRYTGYLAEPDEAGREVRFVEDAPKLRSVYAALGWANENAASTFIRPHWNTGTTYHTGDRDRPNHPRLDLERAGEPPSRPQSSSPREVSGVVGNCVHCDWTGTFPTGDDLRAAYAQHVAASHSL